MRASTPTATPTPRPEGPRPPLDAPDLPGAGRGAAAPSTDDRSAPPWTRPFVGRLVGLLLGAAVALALPPGLGWAVRLVAAWDVAMLGLLGVPWWIILRSTPAATRRHARVEDPGRVAILVFTLAASAIGLVAAVVLLRRPEASVAAAPTGLFVALGLAAVASAWAMVHTAFALHYAHLYYRDDGDPGGLEFPGGEAPDHLDFAYVAFGIGMTFAVSDVPVSDRGIRRLVLVHALLSFAYNTTVLALAISLLLNRLR